MYVFPGRVARGVTELHKRADTRGLKYLAFFLELVADIPDVL